MSRSVSRSYVTRLFEVGTHLKNVFTLIIHYNRLQKSVIFNIPNKRPCKIRDTYGGTQNALLSGGTTELWEWPLSFLVNCTQFLHIFDENLANIPSSSTRIPSLFTNCTLRCQLKNWEIVKTHKARDTLEDALCHPRRATPRTKECFSVSVRCGMFRPFCAWGGEFFGLASFWYTDNRWLRLRQPLRHVTRFIAPSTIAEERLLRHASACLCLKCIPSLT